MLEQKSRPLPKPVPEANIRELIAVAGRLVALMRRETASPAWSRRRPRWSRPSRP
jgi:hypothetical protein